MELLFRIIATYISLVHGAHDWQVNKMKKINYAIEVKSSYALNGEVIENTSISQVADVWSPEREEYIKGIAYNGEYTIEEEHDDRALDEIRADKLAELSSSCNDAITAGMDVETTQGTEHFSLQETDQINLTTALSAVQSGAAGYPYHADGQLCRLFTAAEIQAIAAASVKHKLYHTTLCNHLLTWARRADTREELTGITYAADGMPDDLASNMAAVLAEAAGDNNA